VIEFEDLLWKRDSEVEFAKENSRRWRYGPPCWQSGIRWSGTTPGL